MTRTDVRIELEGPVCTIVLDRPDKRNAVDPAMAAALSDAFAEFEGNASLRVAVLWGAGGHFCSGGDLAALTDPQLRGRLDARGTGPMGPSRLALSKPLIAAVSGFAVAGGLELALLADLRIAERDAVFGVFCRRWGVPLVDGGTARLPRLIGMGRALDMILTGRAVNAAEAVAIGLATRLVAPGEARAHAEILAQQLSSFPQQCLLTDRAAVYGGWQLPLEQALALEAAHGMPVMLEEGVRGAQRFLAGAGRHGSFDC
jgi:enoyl-CoA hydratase/carnithine racemase